MKYQTGDAFIDTHKTCFLEEETVKFVLYS